MRIRFTIFPENGDAEYHCEVKMQETDLKLEPRDFSRRYLLPVASMLLTAFEEPWPDNPEDVLKMLNRGGPDRGLHFYHQRAPGRKH
jgi:hypothetical protein